MDSITFYFLLLIAIIAGWLLGKFGYRKTPPSKSSGSNLFDEYFLGLNYLLNDEPDEAIDTFIKALEINSDTIETHLALGALLRRRGKVDKAINVHQALLARPHLGKEFADSVRLQLALNYIAAGLLDRAERLLKEVLAENSGAKWDALQQLVTVYQTEREWENAISCSAQLMKNTKFKKDPELLAGAAHYCCELAEEYLEKNQDLKARVEIKRAFTFERKNIRAMLLLAAIEQRQGNYKSAIKELLRVRSAKPEFIPQLLGPLEICFRKLDRQAEFEDLLAAMVREDISTDAVLVLSKIFCDSSDIKKAIDLLGVHLEKSSSLQAVVALLTLQIQEVDSNLATGLKSLLNLGEAELKIRAEYRCNHCGFETKNFFWMCSSCRKWDKVRAIPQLAKRRARVA